MLTAQALRVILCAIVTCFVLSGCNKGEVEKLRSENESLRSQISLLEQENAKLKETPDYHYHQGLDFLFIKKYDDAQNEFEIVITKYPSSSLVTSARKQLSAIKRIMDNIEVERIKESTVSLERVISFPAEYQGKNVTFDNVQLRGDIAKHGDEGIFFLRACSENDKCVNDSFSPNGFSLITSSSIASQLLDIVQPNMKYLARLTGTIIWMSCSYAGTRLPGFWACNVSQIDLYSLSGSIFRTIK